MKITLNDLLNAKGVSEPLQGAVKALIDRLEAAESDGLEQARLNGIGAEKELALMAKLEAAEKERDFAKAEIARLHDDIHELTDERDTYKAAYNEWIAKTEWVQDELTRSKLPAKYLGMHRADVIKTEIDSLRARIEAMEKQEPVGVLHVGSYYGEELQDWEFEANQCACDKLNEAYVRNPMSLPLYALPGAQPAPSIPEGWKLVPIEPTVTMKQATDHIDLGDSDVGRYVLAWSEIEALYKAMLAAAPESKP